MNPFAATYTTSFGYRLCAVCAGPLEATAPRPVSHVDLPDAGRCVDAGLAPLVAALHACGVDADGFYDPLTATARVRVPAAQVGQVVSLLRGTGYTDFTVLPAPERAPLRELSLPPRDAALAGAALLATVPDPVAVRPVPAVALFHRDKAFSPVHRAAVAALRLIWR